MECSELYDYLREISGIDAASIGEDAVNRVVKSRMGECGCKDICEYFSLLKMSSDERQRVINELTVPETWFFRDVAPFNLLSRHAYKISSASPGRKIRVLSIPCSSGEEPYSISMALLDSGFRPESFSVDAVDISTRILELANNGVYGRNSFRGGDLSFRSRYFEERSGFYAIADEVKRTVVFHHGNVLARDFMKGCDPYDVIFCRNMLIYFDVKGKSQVIRTLRRLITPDGLLFLGHAETGRMVDGFFKSTRDSGAFAYYPVNLYEDLTSKQKSFCSSNVDLVKAPVRGDEHSENITNPKFKAVEIGAKDGIKLPELSLEDIQCLADKGDIELAFRLCNEFINRHPMMASGYYLHGVICLAGDDDEMAINSFRRAVYLDPKYYEALSHLAVLFEERGDFRSAGNYRARMERLRSSCE